MSTPATPCNLRPQLTTKNSFYRSLQALAQKKVDILIGTQMITKGLDFPDITLVGIINIDNAMNFPDFRSNERAFRTIVQVAGRAGRGEKPGTVTTYKKPGIFWPKSPLRERSPKVNHPLNVAFVFFYKNTSECSEQWP